jgi:threonine dehydratase
MFNNTFRYFDKLRLNGNNIYKYVKYTPITHGYNISKITNNNILYKREDMQITNSFNIRGACLKINSLNRNIVKNGLIVASTGNHAQAIAYLSNILKIHSTILMPKHTPKIKINSVNNFGNKYTKVILYGDCYNDCYDKILHDNKFLNKTIIQAFDDNYIIAGNSTIGYEIYREYKNINKIFVPIGGGGCIAGIAVAIKYLDPNIKIIGVQAENSASMYESIKQKKIISLDNIDKFIDGCAIKTVGNITYDLCKQYIDDIIIVNNDEIKDAIKIGYNDTRVLLEPAGALSIAGIKKYTNQNNINNENIVAILSGANFDLLKINNILKK